MGERAPSVIRKDQPTAARVVAAISLMALIVGGLAIILQRIGNQSLLVAIVGMGWGIPLVMIGAAGLLYHAYNEKDAGYRRLYGFVGAVLLILGVAFRLWPVRTGGVDEPAVMGGYFLMLGAPALTLGLCFLLAFVRNETDEKPRLLISRVIALAAILLIAVGFIGGVLYPTFLMGMGVVHLLLGLIFAAAYVGIESPSSPRGYWAGYALGVIGVVMIAIAIGKGFPFERFNLDFINRAFGWVKWLSDQPGAPFLFAYMGLEYLLLAIGICSDNQLVVLTRRELGSFFFSPIAYIVLVVLALLGGWSFLLFVAQLADASRGPMGGGGIPEPIVRFYFISLVPVICAILIVPVVTMRLLSEEHRSGTLEVLLTAPVKESTVVVSKFLAALRIFMLAWYSWGLYLVALWVEGGVPFDYRAVLSFAIVLLATGAGFVAMGLFFSSVTKNQIVSAILTLMGMIVLLALFLLKESFGEQTGQFWSNVLTYVSFVDLWWLAANGLLAPRYMLFHISFAIFFIFLTVKVLESRKWR